MCYSWPGILCLNSNSYDTYFYDLWTKYKKTPLAGGMMLLWISRM